MEPNISDSEQNLDYSLCEFYFADGEVTDSDSSDLVWKEILRTGSWAYRPGPGQTPQPVPLKVVEGEAGEGEIGLADIIAAYEDGAIQHVTVPTTHEDRPEENTGFVRALRVEESENGGKRLMAGIEFTEPDVKERAL